MLNPQRYTIMNGTPPPKGPKFKVGDLVVPTTGANSGYAGEVVKVELLPTILYHVKFVFQAGNSVYTEELLNQGVMGLNSWLPTSPINHSWGTTQAVQKYNLGDKVRHIPSNNTGTVGNTGDYVVGDWIYWVKYDDGGGSYFKENDLMPMDGTTKGVPDTSWYPSNKCECGSESTYGKDTNLHASYCPKSRS